MSKNTNELKSGSPGRFGIDVYTLGWPMEARILGHEDADPAVLRKKSIQRYAIFLFADHRPTGAGGSWLETNEKQGKTGNSGPFWV